MSKLFEAEPAQIFLFKCTNTLVVQKMKIVGNLDGQTASRVLIVPSHPNSNLHHGRLSAE